MTANQPPSEALRASCHCGAMTVAVTPAPGRTASDLPIRACQCGFCKPRRARWTSDPGGFVELSARDPEAVRRYRFGTGTADFLICGTCGTLTAAVCELGGRPYAVVNIDLLLTAAGVEPGAEQPADFDGEAVDDRLDRRARTWTPVRDA